MQPQGHVQVISRMVDHNLNPQDALDAPRFCIADGTSGGAVSIEEGAWHCVCLCWSSQPLHPPARTHTHAHPGVPEEVIEQLRAMGHDIVPCSEYSRAVFGRGQIIRYNPDTGVMCAGSDGRADGCAMGW